MQHHGRAVTWVQDEGILYVYLLWVVCDGKQRDYI